MILKTLNSLYYTDGHRDILLLNLKCLAGICVSVCQHGEEGGHREPDDDLAPGRSLCIAPQETANHEQDPLE